MQLPLQAWRTHEGGDLGDMTAWRLPFGFYLLRTQWFGRGVVWALTRHGGTGLCFTFTRGPFDVTAELR